MRVIVDTNQIIAALIKKGKTRKIILSINFEFYTLDYVLEEVRKHMDYIVKKAKSTTQDIELLFTLFMENITIISDDLVKKNMNQAIEIMKDIHINDAPILACALSTPNEGIWSDDGHFQEQNKVKAWTTKDILSML